MTEEELRDWEHRSDVIRVLTSYEMGAWLHRRDKRLLQEIWDEIEQKKVHEELGDVFKAHNVAIDGILQIIDKYRGDKNEADN